MIGGAVVDPRTIFHPVMRSQRSNFRKIGNFSNLRVNVSKTIERREMKLLTARSPFNLNKTTCCFGILKEYL